MSFVGAIVVLYASGARRTVTPFVTGYVAV
jgi:hypothetical protein